MIVYVDLEHDRLREQPKEYIPSLGRRLLQKYRFEKLTGDLCLLVRYDRVTPALLRELNARAVLVSGCATDFEHYAEKDLAGLRQVFCEAAWPTIGFCGGHQIMAESYGAPIDAVGPLAPGEPEPVMPKNFGFKAGVRQERGFMPVRVTKPHPLLDGLGTRPMMFESHYWEVKSPPPGFEVYAETDMTGIQMIAHKERPLFGTQFHPEQYDDDHLDGRKLLENFFRIAGITA